MAGFVPAPPVGVSNLSDLDDVDVTAGDGLVSGLPRLAYDDATQRWRPRLRSPFDTESGVAIAGAWNTGPVLPGAVSAVQSAGVVAGGLFYVFGESAAYAFDPIAGSWSTLTAPTPNAARACGRLSDGAIFVGPGADTHTPQVYFPETDTYVTKATMGGTPSVAGCRGDVVNGRAYVLLGQQLRSWDPISNTWTLLASMPVNLTSPNVVGIGPYLYVFGGTNDPTTLRYDPASDSWSSDLAPQIGPALGGAQPVHANGLVYLFGGDHYPDSTVPLLLTYSLAEDAWEDVTTGNEPVKKGAASGFLAGRIVSAGGQPGASGSTDVYLYG